MTSTTTLHVHIEHLRDTLGSGTDRPRLSWIVKTESQNWLQTGYEIEAYDSNGKLRDQTGKVESDQSVLVPWTFAPLASREQLTVRTDYALRDKATSEAQPVAVALIEAKAENFSPSHGIVNKRNLTLMKFQ